MGAPFRRLAKRATGRRKTLGRSGDASEPRAGHPHGVMLTAVLRHVRRQAVGYIALFVALGGVGYAAIPDGSGVVHGCYDTTNQTNGASPLYVIDTSSTSS